MLSRRSFFGNSGAALLWLPRRSEAQDRYGFANCPAEWSYRSAKIYSDPFNEVDLDVIFKNPSGVEYRVAAFWAGGSEWRVRFAPPASGAYSYRTVCSDTSNRELHNRTGQFSVQAYQGSNPLYRHGALRVAEDRRHLEHSDGTPFFWLGDTWWMSLSKRLPWPDGFQMLADDRIRKGFTLAQLVAGLYPDMEPFDERSANEGGFAWERDYARINPAYFDAADVRIQYLADRGLVSCIVGAWGYYLPRMGVRKMKQHWRYLIARWGAYPAIWCLAGEGTMPYYLSKTPAEDKQAQKEGWTEVARYVRALDPLRRPVTIHPSRSARETVGDPSVIDIDMLQTGHDDRKSAPNTIQSVNASLAAQPRMPVLVGEVCYEGIQEASREEVQRFMFWSCMLSGAAGHIYGANGIWQVNTREKPYGLSPHGHSWGGPSWDVACKLPGSRQIGLGKSLLTRYSWWKLQPQPDLVEPRWSSSDYWKPFAARIPGEAVFVYSPTAWKALVFHGLDPGSYRAFLFNPSDGSEVAWGNAQVDGAGNWRAPEFPVIRDWVVVLDRRGTIVTQSR
jgi:hypothetical protein